MGKSTISMAIFNGKLLNHRRVSWKYQKTRKYHGKCHGKYHVFFFYITFFVTGIELSFPSRPVADRIGSSNGLAFDGY